MSYLSGSRYATTPSSSSSAVPADISKDIQISAPPDDSISALSWSSSADLLAVASWDNRLRVYNITPGVGMSGTLRGMIEFQAPLLSCSWSPNGQHVIGAGADKSARLLDLGANGGPAQQVAAHDLSISSVRFFQGPSTSPMIVTGSWDKSIKYWDLRTSQPVATVDCKEKVYSMDVQKKLLVVATAEKGFRVINLDNPTVIFQEPQIPQLKKENRVVRCFPDGLGFVAGTLEGRCAVHYVGGNVDNPNNFSFKCHRDPAVNNITPCHVVNTIGFHPSGIFCTGGSDGTINIWDKDAKFRTKAFPQLGGPITATAFNCDGNLLAYSVSYDWSKGYAYNHPQHVNKIMIHPVGEDEVRRKNASSKR